MSLSDLADSPYIEGFAPSGACDSCLPRVNRITMDEKNPESAWDELVDDLGVEADPASAERHQPQSADLPSASRPEADVPKPQPSDWNALAGSLGLEVTQPAASAEQPRRARVATPMCTLERFSTVMPSSTRRAVRPAVAAMDRSILKRCWTPSSIMVAGPVLS